MSSFSEKLWDLWCAVSLIGIWPRFIEPRLLKVTSIALPIHNLPPKLRGTKIVQFSDLHINQTVSDRFLKALQEKIRALSPDIVLFTGDFLCYSRLLEEERLVKFLHTIKAPFGCYAVFGNHDYQMPVSVNEKGEYDIIEPSSASILKGFNRLFKPRPPTGRITDRALQVGLQDSLCRLLERTPFELLHNRTKTIHVRGEAVNICGLGEYTLGKCLPEQAFRGYKQGAPGIVLSHNPDSLPLLTDAPGDVIFCGHTHGIQVNLPLLRNNLCLAEDRRYLRGLFQVAGKWVYVNRGVGSVVPFRWFSPPEILLATVE